MATYNLVSSIKGGCGKTTFSVWMAYYLKQSLLIDMDLLGTSMQIIFDGSADVQKTGYTSDVFQEVKNSKKQFVEKVVLDSKCINIIFSSMDYKEKEKFKSGRRSGYTPVVKHNIFRLGLGKLIDSNKMIDGKAVDHFIFDMPPNSDGYSDAAMECIFNSKYSVAKKDDKKNLFMMIGTDWGQTIATIYELKSLLLHNDEIEPDRIFLVINHNLGSGFDAGSCNVRKGEIEEAFRNCSLSKSVRDKIFFLRLNHNDNYTKLGIDGKGLRNANTNEINNAFPKGVISAFAGYGETFEDILNVPDGENKLLELLLGV